MGVNGQKRKKKQGPVPSLEESLPKKFKSDKASKPKKNENGIKTNGLGKAPKSQSKEPEKVEKSKLESGEPEDELDEILADTDDFVATKASLFESDDEENVDEFEGLQDEMDLYNPKTVSLTVGIKRKNPILATMKMKKETTKCSAIRRMRKN